MQDIKLAFAEVAERFKETDSYIKEVSQQIKETDKKVKEVSQQISETDKKVKEVSIQIEKTDKKVKEAMNLFTTQWGKLIESLVEGDIVKLFNEKGILVKRLSTRVKSENNGEDYEFDIIAHNGKEIVIVEVKTTLRVKDVKKFLGKLAKVKEWIPAYENHQIYGAMAFLKADEQSAKHSESKGLWVIRATGDSSSIINKETFKPAIY